MQNRFAVIALGLFSIFGSVAAATACDRPTVSGGQTIVEPSGKFNQRVFDEAIRAEVNYFRCKSGLRPLAAAPRLGRVAENHAKWMAKTATVSHNSTVSGQSTVKARIIASGIPIRAGSENIGMVHRFQIEGSSFKIRNGTACDFATHAGQPIAAHSYSSLARQMVGYWMGSSGHRRNILDPKVSMVATRAGFQPNAPYCGQFYISQDFAG